MTAQRVAWIAYTAALWLPGVVSLWRLPRCGPAEPAGNRSRRKRPRKVSVIIPALNEERRLGPLLESLGRQSRPADEIIVVDDGSIDGTAVLARRLGARVVAAPRKPAGWVGKSWACWTGAGRASGDVLVFLDADVRLVDSGLERLVAERERRGGLITVQPYHRVGSLVERLSAVCNIVLMGSLGAYTPFGEQMRPAGGFGPCVVISRSDYRACGGHSAVGDRVVEDMALADVARARGLPVAGLAGKGCVDFRMYPGGLREMVEGWTKGMAPGAGGTPPAARALMIAWIVGATTAVILLGLGIGALVHAEGGGPSRPAGEAGFGFAAVAIYLAYAAQVWWMLRRIGSFGLVTALAFPLPLAFFHGVFFRSAWLSRVGGSVAWRGRRVSLRRHPRRAGT